MIRKNRFTADKHGPSRIKNSSRPGGENEKVFDKLTTRSNRGLNAKSEREKAEKEPERYWHVIGESLGRLALVILYLRVVVCSKLGCPRYFDFQNHNFAS